MGRPINTYSSYLHNVPSTEYLSGITAAYVTECKKLLDSSLCQLSNNVRGVFISRFQGLNLQQYIHARSHHCLFVHKQPCDICPGMLHAATLVLENGCISLAVAYRSAFPNTAYSAECARRRLLHLPVMCFFIGHVSEGTAQYILMENIPGANHHKFRIIIDALSSLCTQPMKTPCLDKSSIRLLLLLGQSERERECVKYSVCKASGILSTKARKLYGFENMSSKCNEVDGAILEIQNIREVIDEIAAVEDKALLSNFGIDLEFENSSDSESMDEPMEDDTFVQELVPSVMMDSFLSVLRANEFNWFALIDHIESDAQSIDHDLIARIFSTLANDTCGYISENEKSLLILSKEAFEAARNDEYEQDRIARIVNGEVVSESESDDHENYPKVESILNDKGRKQILKRRMLIKRRAQREKLKRIAEQRFLSRHQSKRISKIIEKECPNIGNIIEEFVQQGNVGADAWRRTGVLTFDGNIKIPQKVTYEKIRKHLCEVYNRHFSYGSVVELCVSRNKRRRSAKRYKGLAKVTSRRARKGFNIRFNPDSHWSGAFYKGLNGFQFKDGSNALILNRDDAAGFRLDTLTTSKQYTTPTVCGRDVLTTRTDYVNKYPSILQTTSYNFSKTHNTPEICVGVVKAPGLHQKSPAQHYEDLCMLASTKDLKSVFLNSSGENKPIDCIRVDGAVDEGPSHLEIQFWWTLWHFKNKKMATLVTTRCSGCSYLNRVELQNGCLSRGHSNTFIPSTLAGSNLTQVNWVGVNRVLAS